MRTGNKKKIDRVNITFKTGEEKHFTSLTDLAGHNYMGAMSTSYYPDCDCTNQHL
jgi:hypothetical protein